MTAQLNSPNTQIQTKTIDSYTVVYQTAGSPQNPPLLMIHGWVSYKGVWRQTIPALQDEYYCIAVDLLGFGESDKPTDGDYSIRAQGERCFKLMEQLGYERFSVVGHSMGGQIAMCMASIIAPDRIIKLVNVAGVVSANLSTLVNREHYPRFALARRFPWLYRVAKWLTKSRLYISLQFSSWFHDMNRIPLESWEKDRLMSMQPDMAVSNYEAGQAIRALNLTPYLGKITAPTLIVFGVQDNVVRVSDGHLADEHIADSQLVLINHCGHFPMYEQTEQYLAALKLFLISG